MQGSIFTPAAPLPRGPHGLTRAQVAASQRTRLMAAFTELLAERGYAAVTIGELARRAGVSRAAFYEHFADKQACLLAAYDHFAARIVEAISTDVDAEASLSAFVGTALAGYLRTLEDDPVAARAFVVEMDAAGPAAVARRRQAIHGFAALIASRHAALRERDSSLAPLPQSVYLGLALAIRGLVREALEDDPRPKLSLLAPDIVAWITATLRGAAAEEDAPDR